MIYTERKVTIKNNEATIDSTIVLYRGDREVDVLFTVVDHKFRFNSTQSNVINETQASYGQLAIALPDGTNLFTAIADTNNGAVTFTITGEMIDEIHEVGFYSFHIRLYNEDKTSRITLPPVMKGIEIREPLVIEGDVENTDLVGDATVGYSMVQTVGADEDVFDEDGNYIPTVWNIGDKITAVKLNKIEEGITKSNNLPTKVSDLENDKRYVTDSELKSKGYSTFNGDYNNLTNKPAIPSISGLASESYVNEYVENAIKDIPKEEVDLSNYAKKTELPTKLSQLTNDSGYLTNINFSLGVHGDGGIYLFVNGEPVGMGIFLSNVEISTSDGYITDDNTIMLSDNIPSGTYSMKYEHEDGSYSLISDFTI